MSDARDDKALAKKARAWTKLNAKRFAPRRRVQYAGTTPSAELPREHLRKLIRCVRCQCARASRCLAAA